MIISEQLIKSFVEDYTLRELQQISSIILHNFDATNNFIKQFKADHNSHQFYKNVIFWYIKKYNAFPENILTFDFPLNDGGLGDRFIMTTNLLYTINSFGHAIDAQINLYTKTNPDMYIEKELILYANNFYDVIEFFNYKPIKHKIITNKKNNYKRFEECDKNNFSKNKIYLKSHDQFWEDGKYWPINFEPKTKTIITFMFYLINDDGSFVKHTADENKSITFEMLKKFEKIKSKFSNLTFVRLEDVNYERNVELLSRSHFLISSEGMWTHLSRAMKIDTIAFTILEEFKNEFNNQGHFCSDNFDKILEEFETKCTNLLI